MLCTSGITVCVTVGIAVFSYTLARNKNSVCHGVRINTNCGLLVGNRTRGKIFERKTVNSIRYRKRKEMLRIGSPDKVKKLDQRRELLERVWELRTDQN